MREAIWAERLAKVSKSPTDSFSLLGNAEGRLFCLTVARSFVQGVAPFETSDGLARFGPDIQAVLGRYAAADA
jgi:hypothetical protein